MTALTKAVAPWIGVLVAVIAGAIGVPISTGLFQALTGSRLKPGDGLAPVAGGAASISGSGAPRRRSR